MKPKAREKELVVQNLRGETLVYDYRTNRAICLNETATFVWNHCDGKHGIEEIAVALGKQSNQATDEAIVWLAIAELERHDLLVQPLSRMSPLAGMSRREVIREVGLASLIALPLVSALAVPTAAQAASGATCARNVCIRAGQDVCAGCVGQRVTLTARASTNGTCTGARDQPISYNCTGPFIDSFDNERT